MGSKQQQLQQISNVEKKPHHHPWTVGKTLKEKGKRHASKILICENETSFATREFKLAVIQR